MSEQPLDMDRLIARARRAEELEQENASLRKSVLNQCGDNLCWVTDPNSVKALPEAEFLESCRRYRNQVAEQLGELQCGQMTIAQLEAEIARLETEAQWQQYRADTAVDRCDELVDRVSALTREREEARNWLGRVLQTGLPNVLGLPCACDTPELHSDACVNLRKIAIVAERITRAYDAARSQQSTACVRCGAPYLPHGQCSRFAEGCQGGSGEASTPKPPDGGAEPTKKEGEQSAGEPR